MPLDFVRGSQAIMWNNGTLYPIPKAAKYVDDSVFQTVTANGTTYAMGDLGSKVLPESAPEDVTTWKVGTTPRVAWGMRYVGSACRLPCSS